MVFPILVCFNQEKSGKPASGFGAKLKRRVLFAEMAENWGFCRLPESARGRKIAESRPLFFSSFRFWQDTKSAKWHKFDRIYRSSSALLGANFNFF
jgi:hypothetical protein